MVMRLHAFHPHFLPSRATATCMPKRSRRILSLLHFRQISHRHGVSTSLTYSSCFSAREHAFQPYHALSEPTRWYARTRAVPPRRAESCAGSIGRRRRPQSPACGRSFVRPTVHSATSLARLGLGDCYHRCRLNKKMWLLGVVCTTCYT